MDELEALRLELKQQEEALAPINNEKSTLDAEVERKLAEFRAIEMAARKRKRELEELSYDAQRKANELKEKIRQAEYWERVRQQEIAKKLQEEQLALEELENNKKALELFDKAEKLNMDKPWFSEVKPHQLEAGRFITENRNVILADVMGLGKTLSSIVTMDMAKSLTKFTSKDNSLFGEAVQNWIGRNEDGTAKYETRIVNAIERPVGKRVLYFCPKPLINNVAKEYQIWSKGRNVTFVKEMSKKEKDFLFNFVLANHDEFVVICNYDAWRKDLNLIERFIDLDPDTIILDEAHNIKDMKSIAYRGIEQLVFGSNPAYVIPMTGTPVLNRPQELFTLLHLINPREFADVKDFLYMYCEQDNDGHWHFREGGLANLGQKIAKNFMRRTKKQAGIILPPQTVIHHDIELDEESYPQQARVRTEMKKFATIMIDQYEEKAISASAIIAMFTRLRQIETWPAGIKMDIKEINERTGKAETVDTWQCEVEESQKIDYVISPGPDENGNWQGLIPQAIEDERIVLFSQFVIPLEVIKERVERAGKRAVILNGATPQSLRDDIENDFNARTTPDRNNSKWDIVLCNYKVGGAGLNFTAATQLIVLDEEWNPGKRDQAYGRLDRIGQENPTTVHVVRNKGTIDDWMSGLMSSKEEMVDGFNDTMMDVQGFKDFLEDESSGY